MITRRTFLVGSAGVAAAPLAARAQQSSPPARLGYLGIARGPVHDSFLQGMRELGYVEGENLLVERRQYEGNIPRLPDLAGELVRLKVDVIFATGPAPVNAVAKATRDIPLVAIDLESDPIQAGLAASLSRPGGNVTGVFLDLPDLIGKWIEFLRALVPRLSRAAILWDPATGRAQLDAASVAARSLALQFKIMEVRRPEDFDRQFTAAARTRPLTDRTSPICIADVESTWPGS